MEKEALAAKKFTPIHTLIKELELAVGIVFKNDVEPKFSGIGILSGEFPHWDPKSIGLDGDLKKIYGLRIKGSHDFYLPFEGELYGELVFRRINRATDILFARGNEEKPFGFKNGNNYINLRIYRDGNNGNVSQNWQFEPVFILIENHKDIRLFKMSIAWIGDRIKVLFLKPNNPPPFLPVSL